MTCFTVGMETFDEAEGYSGETGWIYIRSEHRFNPNERRYSTSRRSYSDVAVRIMEIFAGHLRIALPKLKLSSRITNCSNFRQTELSKVQGCVEKEVVIIKPLEGPPQPLTSSKRPCLMPPRKPGCMQCRKRYVRCDAARPYCNTCRKAKEGRQCAYLSLVGSLGIYRR